VGKKQITMNYRRGLQRVYAVAWGAWLLVVVFMVLSNRWSWVPWRITPMTWAEAAKEAGLEYVLPPPAGFEMDSAAQMQVIVVSPARKVLWIGALALPLPLLGYFLLFHVSRWVYRGFRPKPIDSSP